MTDSDFPLIKELQNKGIDVVAYFPMTPLNKKSGLISVERMKECDDIIPACEYPEFLDYKEYMDLSSIYVINSYHYRLRDLKAWGLWVKVLKHMKKQNADVFHSIWPLSYCNTILHLLRIKKVFTVHDPFPHSGQESHYDEFNRRTCFKSADALVILNKEQKESFISAYKVPREKIFDNKMGLFSCYRIFPPLDINIKGDYLLFFGNIHPHKGVDFLLDAMLKVHEKHPSVQLIVAGRGKYYFDIEKYKDLDYIHFINEYITVPRLVGLLKGCLFSVVPYVDATQSGVVQTAFSLDVPLVVTNVGALPEVVKDGVMGRVVSPRDSEALASSIIDILDNPDVLNDYKQNIDLIWAKEMDWSPIAEKYIAMYKKIL